MSIVMMTTMKCILIDDSDEDSINLAPNADAEDEEGRMADEKDVHEDEVLEEDEEIMIGGRRSKKVKVSTSGKGRYHNLLTKAPILWDATN